MCLSLSLSFFCGAAPNVCVVVVIVVVAVDMPSFTFIYPQKLKIYLCIDLKFSAFLSEKKNK